MYQTDGGRDRLKYDRKTSTEAVGLKTIKIHLNSTISTEDAKYTAADIGNFYTNSKLESSEYMRIHLSLIPQEIIDKYDVLKYVETDGCVYVELTNQVLQKHLAKY